MRKLTVPLILFSALFFINAAAVRHAIVGSWEFDMGGGFKAQVEYKADNSFVQKMGEMTINGTYTLKNNTLTTVANSKSTVFTIVKSDNASMTVKRNKDGKTLVYTKK